MNLDDIKQLKTPRLAIEQNIKQSDQLEIDQLTLEFLAGGGKVESVSNTLTRTAAEVQMIASRQLYNMSEEKVIAQRAKKKRSRA